VDDIRALISGFALSLSIFGVMISLKLLLSSQSRKQSTLPATLCLVCALTYVGAYVLTKYQKERHDEATRAAISPHAGEHASQQTKPRDRPSLQRLNTNQ
jgi:uncharacterized membrane protein YebE (DUF533 family)